MMKIRHQATESLLDYLLALQLSPRARKPLQRKLYGETKHISQQV